MVAATAVALDSDMDGVLARSSTISIVEAHCLEVFVVVVPVVLDSSSPIVWRLEICCVKRVERKSSIAVTILFGGVAYSIFCIASSTMFEIMRDANQALSSDGGEDIIYCDESAPINPEKVGTGSLFFSYKIMKIRYNSAGRTRGRT